MLVLTRKRTETIVVDGPAVITLISVRGSVAKIGIDAPPSTKALRGELFENDDTELVTEECDDAVL